MNSKPKLPLVYSCSGASSAAQMANHIAVKLDRLKIAEMSCIAGVGGDVKPLVRNAKSGRPIIALDGCPLQCAAQILKRHGLKADKHYDLSNMGVKKKYHEDFDPQQASDLAGRIGQDALSIRTSSDEHDSAPINGIIRSNGDKDQSISSTVELRIKRAYEPSAAEDGERFLVDRLWPRGVKKESMALTGWLKEAAPSAKLRDWFGHDPARWSAFRGKYREELEAHSELLEPVREALRRGVVTLVYSARDEEHNQAVVLREYLLESGSSSRATPRQSLAPS